MKAPKVAWTPISSVAHALARTVGRGARDRQHSEARLGEARLLQHASEHGEGRARHRRPDKQAEPQPVGVPAEARMEPEPEDDPRRDRQGDRGVADGDGLVSVTAQRREVQVEANEEHEEYEPDLGQGPQRVHRPCGEHVVEPVLREEAQRARPQRDAREDLPQHPGLAELRDRRADQPGGQDDDEREQEPYVDFGVRHARQASR